MFYSSWVTSVYKTQSKSMLSASGVAIAGPALCLSHLERCLLPPPCCTCMYSPDGPPCAAVFKSGSPGWAVCISIQIICPFVYKSSKASAVLSSGVLGTCDLLKDGMSQLSVFVIVTAEPQVANKEGWIACRSRTVSALLGRAAACCQTVQLTCASDLSVSVQVQNKPGRRRCCGGRP